MLPISPQGDYRVSQKRFFPSNVHCIVFSTEFVESWAFRVRFLFNFSAFVVKSIVRKSEREDLLLNDYN